MASCGSDVGLHTTFRGSDALLSEIALFKLYVIAPVTSNDVVVTCGELLPPSPTISLEDETVEVLRLGEITNMSEPKIILDTVRVGTNRIVYVTGYDTTNQLMAF